MEFFDDRHVGDVGGHFSNDMHLCSNSVDQFVDSLFLSGCELSEKKFNEVLEANICGSNEYSKDIPCTTKNMHLSFKTDSNSSMMSETTTSPSNVVTMTCPPVTRGIKGLAFDADRIADDWLRDRLLRNRASAERSRQRRKNELKGMADMMEQLEGECAELREENRGLRRQLEILQVSKMIIA